MIARSGWWRARSASLRGWICLVLVASPLGGCTGADDEPADAGPSDGALTDGGGSGLLSDPLSMPDEAIHEAASFSASSDCVSCHPTQVEQWQTSAHSYAMEDPVFRALVHVRHADENGRNDRFCVQCHSNVASRTGLIADQLDAPGVFAALPAVAQEGVTCVSCHQVTAVERTHNAGHTLDPAAPMGGRLDNPAEGGFHASEHQALMGESQLCGSCHDVVETTGVPIERPFSEWLESPVGPLAPEQTTCQDCHMPRYDGRAATMGPERKGLRRHGFVGVDVPRAGSLDAQTLAERVSEVDALLQTAAGLTIEATGTAVAGERLDLSLTVENRIDGHNLPTGTTFIRQCWLHVVVRDAAGAVLYETGDLDEDGDLRDAFSVAEPYGDHDLMRLGSVLIDDRGAPTIFTWQASEHVLFSLPPHHERTWVRWLDVPADAQGPLQVEARLRFRPMPPYLLRALGLGTMVEHTRIHDMATASMEIALVPRPDDTP